MDNSLDEMAHTLKETKLKIVDHHRLLVAASHFLLPSLARLGNRSRKDFLKQEPAGTPCNPGGYCDARTRNCFPSQSERAANCDALGIDISAAIMRFSKLCPPSDGPKS